jgi:hypothetical protein
MTTLMTNPRFTLTQAQTDELRKLWQPLRNLVEPSKDTLVTLKLSRRAAVFSRRQLYMIAATMVNLGVGEVPGVSITISNTDPRCFKVYNRPAICYMDFHNIGR